MIRDRHTLEEVRQAASVLFLILGASLITFLYLHTSGCKKVPQKADMSSIEQLKD